MESKIYLRALELEDYKTTVQWRNDDDIWKMVTGPKYFVSSEYERVWIIKAINNPNELRLGICLKENGKLIGLASMIKIDTVNRNGVFSIMIGEKEYWSGGHGFDAIKLLADYCFNERGMERIWAPILKSNLSSQRLAEKCGAKIEGVLRKSIYKDGAFHDQVIVAVLKEDYLKFIAK